MTQDKDSMCAALEKLSKFISSNLTPFQSAVLDLSDSFERRLLLKDMQSLLKEVEDGLEACRTDYNKHKDDLQKQWPNWLGKTESMEHSMLAPPERGMPENEFGLIIKERFHDVGFDKL